VDSGNTAMKGEIGFAVYLSNGNTLTGNRASLNQSDGFHVNDASSNTFAGNIANTNGADGFNVFFGSELNIFTQNSGCGNAFVDARDTSTGGGNTWLNNSFCTADGIS